MRIQIAAIALALGASLPSCVLFRSDPRCYIFSEPPGAAVLVDGVDTGFTTPAVLEPGSATIGVEKDGYFSQARSVDGRISFRFPRHNDGGASVYAIAFPLFWTFEDLIFPFQVRTREHPRRLYFRLVPLDRPDEAIATLASASSSAAAQSNK